MNFIAVPRIFKDRISLENLSDVELIQYTRFDRQAIEYLKSLIEEQVFRDTKRSASLDTTTQLLIALTFYASGSFQWAISTTYGVTQPSVSRSIHAVTDALCALAPTFIRFPMNEAEIRDIKLGFSQVAGLPNVIGCIDGTHIAIKAPFSDEEPAFVNRKGYHSVNVQMVCDNNLIIRDVVAKWPGSSHDSFIWRMSGLKTIMERGIVKNAWLLGDSGYPLEPWLMTPVTGHALTAAEANYNRAHARTRNAIERLFGVLKSRFRCLDKSGGTLLYTAKKVCKTVVACAVLHNISRLRGIPVDDNLVRDDDNDDQQDGDEADNGQQGQLAIQVRRDLIQQYFG